MNYIHIVRIIWKVARFLAFFLLFLTFLCSVIISIHIPTTLIFSSMQ